MTTSGDTISMDLTQIAVPENASCWARAYIQGGLNHDSRDNFNYDPNSSATVTYTVTGGSQTPSFSMSP